MTRIALIALTIFHLVNSSTAYSQSPYDPFEEVIVNSDESVLWKGSIAIQRRFNGNKERPPYLYHANGFLHRYVIQGKELRNRQTLGENGWSGSISVDNGHVYLQRGRKLLRAKVDEARIADGLHIRSYEIGPNRWGGSIDVWNSNIHLAYRGRLRRGRIVEPWPVTARTEIGANGWNGDIAVDGTQIYLAHSRGILRTVDLAKSNQSIAVAKIPPNCKIAVHGCTVYLADGERLLRSRWPLLPLPSPPRSTPGMLAEGATRVLRLAHGQQPSIPSGLHRCNTNLIPGYVGRRSEGDFIKLKDGTLVFA